MKNQDKIQWVDIEDVIPFSNNSRTHSDSQVGQIAALIREYGWTQPIVVSPDLTILAGHGRLAAARKLKEKKVPVIVLDGLSDAQKRAYVIADNKVAMNSGWDVDLLKAELEHLSEVDFDLSLLGFDTSELGTLMGLDDEDIEEGEDESDQLKDSFDIVVKCDSENKQIELLDEFQSRGLECRALV